MKPSRTRDRGQKLKEASEQQQFLRAVEDMEQWILDMEAQMASEDLGKDLISVNILIKKHAVSEGSAEVVSVRVVSASLVPRPCFFCQRA